MKKNFKAKYIVLTLVTLLVTLSICSGEDHPEGAVIDSVIYDYQIEGDGCTLKFRQFMTIYSPRAVRKGLNDIYSYENKFCNISDFHAVVRDSLGNKLYEREKKDFWETCGFDGGSVYNDICFYSTELEAPQYPYTIEYNYKQKFNTLFYLRGSDFQTEFPVKFVSFTLNAPSDLPIHYQSRGKEFQPEISYQGLQHIYKWQLTNLPPLKNIDFVPENSYQLIGLRLFADRVNLEGIRVADWSWSEIGYWYNRLAANCYSSSGTFPYKTDGTPNDKIRDIYHQVIENTRYVSIQLGIGGWRPTTASLTRDRKYGDCKDMSTLLISELRFAGIKAYPVLVMTDKGIDDIDFPNFGFNHVIAVAVVDQDTIWMDPTCSNCPPGVLRSDVENLNVLTITDKGGEIWKTPASKPEQNMTVRNTSIHIKADNKLNIDTKISIIGINAYRMRSYLNSLDNDETKSYVNNFFIKKDRLHSVESWDIENLEDIKKPLIINIKATRFKILDVVGDKTYCSPFVLSTLYGNDNEKVKDREYSLDMGYPDLIIDTISINWDENILPDSVIGPTNKLLSYDFAEANLKCHVDDNLVRVIFHKATKVYTIEPDYFEEFTKYQKQLRKLFNKTIKLVNSKTE